MLISEALKARLISTPELFALIGNRALGIAVTKHTPMPAVTYFRISTSPIKHRGPVGLRAIRMQIDGWANTYSEALALRLAILASLEGYTQTSAPRVDACILQDDREIHEASPDTWRASLDYLLMATEQ